MPSLSPVPKLQFLDASGAPLAGGKLYSYASGTSTPLATYTDSTGGVANANPVILDSRGEASVWLSSANYKLVLKSASDVTIWTVDSINGADSATMAVLAASGGSTLVGYLPGGAGAVSTTVQAKLRESVSVKDFGAVGDGVTDDTAAIQAALNSGAKVVHFPDGTYLLSAAITPASNQDVVGCGGTLAMPNNTFLDGILISGKTNVQVRGLRIVGASAGNSFDRAIAIDASTNVIVDGNLIQDIGNEAISPNEWGTGIEVLGNSANVKITNNTIKNIKGYGQYRGDGITVRASSNTLIHGNTIDTVRRMQVAIIDDALDVKVTDNHLLNGYLAGVDIEPNSINTTSVILVRGNTIRNFGSKPGATTGVQYHGVDIHGNGVYDVIVEGNTIMAAHANSVACVYAINGAKFIAINDNVLDCNGVCAGVVLSAGSGSTDLVIANNVIRQFKDYGIQGYKNGNIIVDGNNITSTISTVSRGVQLTSDGTTLSSVVTNNVLNLTGASVLAGIYVQAAVSLGLSDNYVNVAAGNGIEVYSNAAGMVNGSIAGNVVYGNGSVGNGYYIRAAGAGAIVGLNVGENVADGFTNPIVLSGSYRFVKDVLATYLGSTTNGNVSVTLTAGVSAKTQIFNTALTVNRTVTLSTTNAKNGDSFRVVRGAGATGAFTLDVGGLKTLTAASQWCEVMYDGAAWVLTAYGTL